MQKRGQDPILIVSGMERDEAAKSGLEIETYADLDIMKVSREATDTLEAGANVFLHTCEVLGITGKIAFYGTGDIPYTHSFLSAVEEAGVIEVCTEPCNSIISEARMTRDDAGPWPGT